MSNQKIYSIYKATNTVTKKVYIGYTERALEKRIADHHRSSKRVCNDSKKFYSSIKKHGFDVFEWEVIYQSLDGLHCKNVMETHFINEYNSYHNGYNSTFGGEGVDSESNSFFAKRKWENPEYAQRMHKIKTNGVFQTSEYRESQGEKSRELWKDPEYAFKVLEGVNEFWQNTDNRKAHSEKLKAILAAPEERKRLSENQKKCWDKPGYRENQSIKQSAAWDNPESSRYKLKGTYEITDPEGNTFVVVGMKKFCRERNLNSKAMLNLSNRKITSYKGWKVTRIDK